MVENLTNRFGGRFLPEVLYFKFSNISDFNDPFQDQPGRQRGRVVGCYKSPFIYHRNKFVSDCIFSKFSTVEIVRKMWLNFSLNPAGKAQCAEFNCPYNTPKWHCPTEVTYTLLSLNPGCECNVFCWFCCDKSSNRMVDSKNAFPVTGWCLLILQLQTVRLFCR